MPASSNGSDYLYTYGIVFSGETAVHYWLLIGDNIKIYPVADIFENGSYVTCFAALQLTSNIASIFDFLYIYGWIFTINNNNFY
ncbi:Hypothetical protein EUBELI_01009 [Lachnospira eligens ATCC 27750]|uniref:Uncharacterized protein n=1 Tax=Lachnospira eligens (strain ATCC 27750 / DSM 3376 / VPI C15-48 / C15-B4) TaxID=515620 RepID=C4Z097_LACE2|nr:Hypothetical protein EUBELI_01009 [[Eubacterium] eligens ATCC 27750]